MLDTTSFTWSIDAEPIDCAVVAGITRGLLQHSVLMWVIMSRVVSRSRTVASAVKNMRNGSSMRRRRRSLVLLR